MLRCWRKITASLDTGPAVNVGATPSVKDVGVTSVRSKKRRPPKGEMPCTKQPTGQPSAGDVARAVGRWANGKDLPGMLGALQPFAHILGEQASATDVAGLGPHALRRAYHKACLQLHPDRHALSSPRTQVFAEELFKVLSSSFVDHHSNDIPLSTMAC